MDFLSHFLCTLQFFLIWRTSVWIFGSLFPWIVRHNYIFKMSTYHFSYTFYFLFYFKRRFIIFFIFMSTYQLPRSRSNAYIIIVEKKKKRQKETCHRRPWRGDDKRPRARYFSTTIKEIWPESKRCGRETRNDTDVHAYAPFDTHEADCLAAFSAAAFPVHRGSF